MCWRIWLPGAFWAAPSYFRHLHRQASIYIYVQEPAGDKCPSSMSPEQQGKDLLSCYQRNESHYFWSTGLISLHCTPLVYILNIDINGPCWNSWNERMWPTVLQNKAVINKIIIYFIKKKKILYYKENKSSVFHSGIMATARAMCRGVILVLQITTPTRKGVQDVTLQLLHHQEKISMADHCLREMSVFPASVLGEACTGINSFLGEDHC